MRRFEEFFTVLTAIRSLTRGKGNKIIKKVIGDSTNNKRTVTVLQTIRYMEATGDELLAKELKVVLGVLENKILSRRNRRTDAIDLTELTNTYREVVMNKAQLRREIGTALAKVA